MKFCSHCGKEIDENVRFCPSCGKAVECNDTSMGKAKKAVSDAASSLNDQVNDLVNPKAGRSRIVAGALALFPVTGSLGIQKFYCGKYAAGVLSIIFSWTAIPWIIGIVDGVKFLTTETDEEFVEKYCVIR